MSLLAFSGAERSKFSLRGHLDAVARFPDANQDAVYLVVGRRGKGKSTLARKMSKYLAELREVEFSSRPLGENGDGGNIAYPGQCTLCIAKGTDYLARGSPVITDEAMRTYFSRNSGKVSQKLGITNLAMSRYECLIQFYLLPKRRYADVFLREDLSEFLIDVWSERHREDGLMVETFGHATFYHADLHTNPFVDFSYFNEDANFDFEKDDDPEYEYYKDNFTRLAKQGYECPWTEIEWKPGARRIPTAELLELVGVENEVTSVVNEPESFIGGSKEKRTDKDEGRKGEWD